MPETKTLKDPRFPEWHIRNKVEPKPEPKPDKPK